MNALNDMKQSRVEWDCGTTGIGVVLSDSLMFERGDPAPGDAHLSNVYGLALPLVKHGVPVSPVQLESVTAPHYLDGFQILLLSYHGQKPLTADVHSPLADWVRKGGMLVVIDDDADPYNKVSEWWNSGSDRFATPREHLFRSLQLTDTSSAKRNTLIRCGKGGVYWLNEDPAAFAKSSEASSKLINVVRHAALAAGTDWRTTNFLLLRRGPYLIGAGLEESETDTPKKLAGRFINLFDFELRVQRVIDLQPGNRVLLLDLDAAQERSPRVLASACKCVPKAESNEKQLSLYVEGVGGTSSTVLVNATRPPQEITLSGASISDFTYDDSEHLLWVRFTNEPSPRELNVRFQ